MKIVFSTLLVLSPLFTIAQSSKVVSAKIAVEQEQYDDALEKLNEALKKPNALKDRVLGDAWLYKGKALLGQFRKAAQTKNLAILEQDNVLEAYRCFEKVYDVTDDKGVIRATNAELQNIQYSIFPIALGYMQSEDYSTAIEYISCCKAIEKRFPNNNKYSYYNVSGQCQLFSGDTLSATNDFIISKDAYKADQPDAPDFGIGYVYYYLAFIYRYQQDDADKTLAIIEEGLKHLETEKSRLISSKEPNEEALLQGYEQVKAELNRYELDVYINYPDKYVEALEKFKIAAEQNPEDESILLAYGNLVEKSDDDAGYEAYKKVLEINPSNTIALFNAGANRVNKGVGYARLANEESDYVKSQEWQDKVNEQFELALPYLEKCAELKPDDLYVLDALIQVTTQLELMDKYKEYTEKRSALRGYWFQEDYHEKYSILNHIFSYSNWV